MFNIGQVKLPNDEDFDQAKRLCEQNDEWELASSKVNTKIWVKNNEFSTFKMIKVKCDLENLSPDINFDVFMDGEYSLIWDTHTIESQQVCNLFLNFFLFH